MGALVPAIPALIGLATTVVGAVTRPDPPDPLPTQNALPEVDQELRDAMKRKGRQRFVKQDEDTLVGGGTVGSPTTLGQPTTLVTQ